MSRFLKFVGFWGMLLATLPSWGVNIEFVPVGDAGNLPDSRTGHGEVDYNYSIGKYDVTSGQYCEFLNTVATVSDPYGLYNTDMDVRNNVFGCNIIRVPMVGGFTYSVASEWANRPVNYVSWGDSARFCNWLQTGNTENGAYTLNGAMSNEALMAVKRNDNAQYVLPTIDEWYKAAYYDPGKPGGAGYWLYPTKSDLAPSNILSKTETNHANFFDYGGTGTGEYTIGSPYYRTNVGEFEASPSAYGTYDQGGNVGNWEESLGENALNRNFNGADFMSESLSMASTLWNNSLSPTREDIGSGFRIASLSVPEPTTALLLLFAAIGYLFVTIFHKS